MAQCGPKQTKGSMLTNTSEEPSETDECILKITCPLDNMADWMVVLQP